MKETFEEKGIELEPKRGQIKRLCSVVRRAYGGRELLFIGWTKEGKPTVTDNEDHLADEVQESFSAFQTSGLGLREIKYSNLTTVEYAYTGRAIDFRDQDLTKAEDLIIYGIKDQEGASKPISLSELTVLQSIVNAQTPWQDIGPSKMGEIAVSAKPMYTLFVPTPEMARGSALAILFKPTIEGESNEASFKSFIRQTIGRLLVLDESQEPRNRKGYLKAAAKFAGKRGTKGTLDILFALRAAGLVEFEDQWLENFSQRKRNMVAKGLKIARLLGFVEVNDDTIERYRHPLPYYDVDLLDINQLFNLADAMERAARQVLGK